jgi:hypothetical protein
MDKFTGHIIAHVRFSALTRLNYGFVRNLPRRQFRRLLFDPIARLRASFCRVNCKLEYIDGFYIAWIVPVGRVVE